MGCLAVAVFGVVWSRFDVERVSARHMVLWRYGVTAVKTVEFYTVKCGLSNLAGPNSFLYVWNGHGIESVGGTYIE